MKFEEKLIALRKSKNWSQEALAEKLGTTRQAVSRWETGITLPDVENLKKICDVFSVSADYLINDNAEDIGKNKHIERQINTRAYLFLVSGVTCWSLAVFNLIYGIKKQNPYSFVAMGLNLTLTVVLFRLFRNQKYR